MKSLCLIFTSLLLVSQTLLATNLPEVVNIGLKKAFVPIGFDDNDRIQFVVEGAFNSTCYKVGPYQVHKDMVSQTVRVQQTAYKYAGFCLQMLVPFTQVIDAGLVDAGEYSIKDHASGTWIGKLPVERATKPSPDDYLYAPVTGSHIVFDEEKKTNILMLSGAFTDRCTKLKEVKVHYYTDVIVVQPIAERVIEERDCEPTMIRFQYPVEMQSGLKGNFLLHVRSMNGQAINQIVELF